MHVKRRFLAVILPVLMVGGIVTLGTGEADAATLSCTTTTGNTGGTATCKGSGVWRIRLNCVGQADQTGSWVRQTGGTVRQISTWDCWFKNRQTMVDKL